MTAFPPAPPRIHEEQIVLVHHDAHNNYHCPDRSCVCWADEREPSSSEDTGYDAQADDPDPYEDDGTGTHEPSCRCPWCENS